MSFFGKILLGSGSPRRLQLLTEAGFDVTVLKVEDIEETYPETLEVHRIPEYLSRKKAAACRQKAGMTAVPIVTADTIVILGGKAIGKPESVHEAKKMLRHLSDHTHTVVTGVTFILPDGSEHSFSQHTEVKFGHLTDAMIDYYVEKYNPVDKAGSYGIQEWIGLVGVESIHGDFYNIMGFPVNSFIKKFTEATRAE